MMNTTKIVNNFKFANDFVHLLLMFIINEHRHGSELTVSPPTLTMRHPTLAYRMREHQ